MSWPSSGTLFIGLMLAGCDRGQPVVAPRDYPAALGVPTLSPAPDLTISIPDSIGGASAEMGRAEMLGDGSIAMADWDGQRILVFDSAGALTRVIGRAGSGPGEFRAPVLTSGLAGDSLLVWDPYLRRISRLSATTGSGRESNLSAEAASGSAPLVGELADGPLVLRHERFDADPRTGGTRVTTEIRLLDPRGGKTMTIMTIEAVPHGDAQGFRFFSPRIQVAVAEDRILVGYPDRWEIDLIDAAGSRVGTLIRPWTARRVTEADRARVRDAMTRPDLAPGFLDDDRFDLTWPAFGTILRGPCGTIWVLEYAAPYISPDSASIFDRDGTLVGVLGLPADFKPTAVTEKALIGTAWNDLGVIEIRRYGVRWP